MNVNAATAVGGRHGFIIYTHRSFFSAVSSGKAGTVHILFYTPLSICCILLPPDISYVLHTIIATLREKSPGKSIAGNSVVNASYSADLPKQQLLKKTLRLFVLREERVCAFK